jgi:hypothetical protein
MRGESERGVAQTRPTQVQENTYERLGSLVCDVYGHGNCFATDGTERRLRGPDGLDREVESNGSGFRRAIRVRR